MATAFQNIEYHLDMETFLLGNDKFFSEIKSKMRQFLGGENNNARHLPKRLAALEAYINNFTRGEGDRFDLDRFAIHSSPADLPPNQDFDQITHLDVAATQIPASIFRDDDKALAISIRDMSQALYRRVESDMGARSPAEIEEAVDLTKEILFAAKDWAKRELGDAKRAI